MKLDDPISVIFDSDHLIDARINLPSQLVFRISINK